MNLDDSSAVGTSSPGSSVSARGRTLRYLLLGVLTALVAGGVASWARSRSKTEHWQSAPTGWTTHTPEPPPTDPEVVDVTAVAPEADGAPTPDRSDLRG